MTGDVTPLHVTWDEALRDVETAGDMMELKKQLSLEWVLEQYGVPLGAQGRTACISPAHESPDPNFAVWVSEDGSQAGYCYACGFHADIFKVVMQFENIQFSRAKARASKLLVKFRKAEESGWLPTIKHQERTEPDTQRLGQLVLNAQGHHYTDPSVIEAFIAEKRAAKDPGYDRVTPEFLLREWGIGSEDKTVSRRVPVSNPDASPYPYTVRTVHYQRVVIPYFARMEDGTLQVRGIKDRTRFRVEQSEGWGEWTPFGKPIWRPGPDTSVLYGSWRISGGGAQGGNPSV